MKAEGRRHGARNGWPRSRGGPVARMRAKRGCHFGVGQLRRRPGLDRGERRSQSGGRGGHVGIRGGVKRAAREEGSAEASHRG